MKYLLLISIIAFTSCERCYKCAVRVEMSMDSTYIYTDGIVEKCGGRRADNEGVDVIYVNGHEEKTTTDCK